MHGDIISACGRFRVYLQLVTLRDNQETPLRTGVLYGRPHELVDELFQDDLA